MNLEETHASRRSLDLLDVDVGVFLVGLAGELGELLGDVGVDLEAGLAPADLHLAEVALHDAAATAEHRQQPLRIGALLAPDVDAEPHAAHVVVAAAPTPSRRRRPIAVVVAV